MHTLIGAPVLGFDLTRLPGGSATAGILTALLGFDTAGMAALASWVRTAPARLAHARHRAEAGEANRPPVSRLVGLDPEALERAPIGNLSTLLHCVRTDVLVPDYGNGEDGPVDGDLVEVVCDAIRASYLSELVSAQDRRTLSARWVSLRRLLPEPGGTRPWSPSVEALLTRVRGVTRTESAALLAAAERMRSERRDWASAMHSATWAVHLSDRVRSTAAAQFELVQAVDVAGIPVGDRAAGVWNVLSGAVQALSVRDMVDGSTAHELLVPCLAALGPGWLSLD
ncbi:hypothetical protein GCM10022243_41330 [Saccharothrix violaceirubra]|uniref:Uncharacterized protein n=1 Tax=Saccharothrix violaceirubra TaxID=413306 RepID=A0A7W7WYC4_9PSEU|nr:hypothetical protein [Saccharothrix violaceirubra]MBB4968389.1 hypothetical protein [Saccharothrix violaceirubra]